MSDRDPNQLLEIIKMVINFLPLELKAAVFAVSISFLRILYDDREPSHIRRLLEALLCGAITVACSHLVSALGASAHWSMFIGGMVGLLGADYIRDKARKFATEKIRSMSNSPQRSE